MIINAREIIYAQIQEDVEHEDFIFRKERKYRDSQLNFMLGRIGKIKKPASVVTSKLVYDECSSYESWCVEVPESDYEKNKIVVKNQQVFHWPRLLIKTRTDDVFVFQVHPSRIRELHAVEKQILEDKTNIRVQCQLL